MQQNYINYNNSYSQMSLKKKSTIWCERKYWSNTMDIFCTYVHQKCVFYSMLNIYFLGPWAFTGGQAITQDFKNNYSCINYLYNVLHDAIIRNFLIHKQKLILTWGILKTCALMFVHFQKRTFNQQYRSKLCILHTFIKGKKQTFLLHT